MAKRMKWKRRYSAEIPDPSKWEQVAFEDGWLLYRALELVDGWRNYRLIHRRPAKTRVSFRLAWHPSERRFALGKDHIYLAKHDPVLIEWTAAFALQGPDKLAMHTDMPGRLEARQRVTDAPSGLGAGHAGKPVDGTPS